MAVLTTIKSLKNAILELDSDRCPQAWIGDDRRLKFGVFPNSMASFDFAGESLRQEENSPKGATLENQTKRRVRDVSNKAARKTEKITLEFSDLDLVCGSAKQALLEGMDEIERRQPGTLDKVSRVKGRSKRPVHREREELYDLPTQQRYSERIKSGHWVATNNKRNEALDVLELTANVANISLSIR